MREVGSRQLLDVVLQNVKLNPSVLTVTHEQEGVPGRTENFILDYQYSFDCPVYTEPHWTSKVREINVFEIC